MSNVLKVPDSGLRLAGPDEERDELPPQAFLLNLNDDVIEGLLRAVQDQREIRLQLGDEPTLEYNSQRHIITPPADSLPNDLYLTKPYESMKSAMRIAHTGSLFEQPITRNGGEHVASGRAATEQKASSSSSGLESDYEILQNSLAAEEAARGRTQIVDKAMPGKRGTTKLKGRTFSPNPSSIPGSPALRGVGSPSHSLAQSASQQAMEKAKRDRLPLVHELAVQDQTLEHLQNKWAGNKADFRTALDKIADKLPNSDLWGMRKNYWKELDVWSYEYDTQEERDKAIENAVRHFDKQRMSRGEPEWERLNKPADRGKGICLSKLQARIATKEAAPPASTAAPKIKVQKADDSSLDERENLTDGGQSTRGGERMSRTGSNPLPAKTKAQDAQTKRLLGTGKAKPPAPKAGPKTSPTKAAGKVSKAPDGRILSQEIIEDSDSSGDEAGSTSSKAPKTSKTTKPPSVTATSTPRSKPKPTQAPKSSTLAREGPKPTSAKRSREEEDSSSSSGTPLAKRLKGRPITQSSRATQGTSEGPGKSAGSHDKPASKAPAKVVSPRKSSPLASTPTNASDMEPEGDSTPEQQPSFERPRPKPSIREAPPKRRRFPDELMELTAKFKSSYTKYERFHRQVSSEANPDPERVARLVQWHNKLDAMKKRIQNAA